MSQQTYTCANSTNFAMGTGAKNGGDRPTTILADPNPNSNISYSTTNSNNFAIGLNAHQTTQINSKILLCSATMDKVNVVTNRIDVSGIVQRVCTVLKEAQHHADYITACTWDDFKTALEQPYDVVIMVFHSNSTIMEFKDITVSMKDVGTELTLAGTPKLVILMGCESSSILEYSDMPILSSKEVIFVSEAETIMRTILSHLYVKKTTIGQALSTVTKVFSKLAHKLTEEQKNTVC